MGSVKEIIFPPEGPPFAKREDGMSLDVIGSAGGSFQSSLPTRPILVTEDIAKIKRTYSVPPAEKISYQRTYYPTTLRKPRDLSLTTGDIYGARPRRVCPGSKRRTDPVQPCYEMPGGRDSIPTEPFAPRGSNQTFVLQNRDIEKSYWEPQGAYKFATREHIDCSDIAYATSNYRNRHVKPSKYPGVRYPPEESLERAPRNYRDTNPLDPVYHVSQIPGAATVDARWTEEKDWNANAPKPVTIPLGPPVASKPRKLSWSNSEPQLSLITQDINSAFPQRWVGELPFNMYQPRTDHSKPILNTINHDIPGAQVGTLKTGLWNVRETNPLNPTYKFLDGTISSWKTGSGGQATAPLSLPRQPGKIQSGTVSGTIPMAMSPMVMAN